MITSSISKNKIARQIAKIMMKYFITFADINQAWNEIAQEKARENYEKTQLENLSRHA